jgi:hypothetical protein
MHTDRQTYRQTWRQVLFATFVKLPKNEDYASLLLKVLKNVPIHFHQLIYLKPENYCVLDVMLCLTLSNGKIIKHDAVYYGKSVLTFQRILLSPSSW